MRATLQLLGAAAVVIGLVAGCGVVSDAEHLSGSAWTVLEIDGEAVPSGEIYLFFDSPRRDTALLVTHINAHTRGLAPRCREGVADFAMDTDGNALSFGDFEEADLSEMRRIRCDSSLSELHDRVATALAEAEWWQATGDALEIVGTSTVRLAPSGGDSD